MKRLIFCLLMILGTSVGLCAQQNPRVWVIRGGMWVLEPVYERAFERSAEMQAAQAADIHAQRQFETARRREVDAWSQFQNARQRNPYDPDLRRSYDVAMRTSMERARAEANRNLVRERNIWAVPYTYGVPNRNQWLRQPPNARIPSPPRDRMISDRERTANANRDQARDRMHGNMREIERAVREGRFTRDSVRDYNQSMKDYLDTVREASRARREAADRNGSRDTSPRDSPQSRDSGSKDKSWQDHQREIFDRRP